jgi:hypothetical protein
MPTTCQWDDDSKNIIYIAYEGDWTWEEYFGTADVSRSMALSVEHRVDYICDFQKSINPQSGSQIANGRLVMQRLAANSGIVVTVDNAFTKMLLKIFKAIDRQLGAFIYGASSIEEARRMIAKHRAEQAAKILA